MTQKSSRVLKEARSKVFVVTLQYEFVGHLHLINLDRRESDVLNDSKPFVHLTDAEIKVKKTGKSSKVPFVAINKQSIICVVPMDDKSS